MATPIIEATMDGGVAFYKRQGDPGMAPCTDAQLQDRDFVLGLVAHCGLALSLAAPHLKEDADVVLAAVRQSGWALEFASAALRGDRELVLLAVRDAGWALQYACGEAVKGDREIVKAAVTQVFFPTSSFHSALSLLQEIQLFHDFLFLLFNFLYSFVN